MFVDSIDNDSLAYRIGLLYSETQRALVTVFELNPREAATRVAAFVDRMESATVTERKLLLHKSPIYLAADLAKIDYRSIEDWRAKAFISTRPPAI